MHIKIPRHVIFIVYMLTEQPLNLLPLPTFWFHFKSKQCLFTLFSVMKCQSSTNGHLHLYTSCTFEMNTTCGYWCVNGYKKSDPPFVVCSSNGTWNKDLNQLCKGSFLCDFFFLNKCYIWKCFSLNIISVKCYVPNNDFFYTPSQDIFDAQN